VKIKKARKDSEKTLRRIKYEAGLKKYIAWEALWKTKAYRDFCQRDQDRVEKELAAELREISQKPENEREDYELQRLKWDHDTALNDALQRAFVSSFEGQNVMRQLKEFEFKKLAISCSRELVAGKYLSCSIDLTFSKKQIRAEFENILKKKHRPGKRPPRGAAIMGLDEINHMFRAYNLVENFLGQGESYHQGVLKATWQLYTKARRPRLKNPPAEDKRYQQVLRWHKKMKNHIGDL